MLVKREHKLTDKKVKAKNIAILVVDDDAETKDRYINKFAAKGIAQNGISLLSKSYGPEISTADYCKEALNDGFVIGAIIMDGSWIMDGENGDNINTVETLRQWGYKGLIIAASASQRLNKKLLEAGADCSIGEDFPDDYDRDLNKMIAVTMAIDHVKEIMK